MPNSDKSAIHKPLTHTITVGYRGEPDDLDAVVAFCDERGMDFLHGSCQAPDFEGWPARAGRLEDVLTLLLDRASDLINVAVPAEPRGAKADALRRYSEAAKVAREALGNG